MHAPRCHYGPLRGGDRDGAEGVDRCGCLGRLSLTRLSLTRLSNTVCETLPTKWPRSTNMAPAARSKWFTSDDRYKMFNTFIFCLRVFGTAWNSNTITTNSPTAVVSPHGRVYMNEKYLHRKSILLTDVKRSIKKEQYVHKHCKFPH